MKQLATCLANRIWSERHRASVQAAAGGGNRGHQGGRRCGGGARRSRSRSVLIQLGVLSHAVPSCGQARRTVLEVGVVESRGVRSRRRRHC